MLQSLTIDNLVLVRRAEINLRPGLTAVTGETGAGKTLLAQAIGLLFGASARADLVGPASGEAYVEGTFTVGDEFWDDPRTQALAELRPDGEAELVLARKVFGDGRTRALAWGRSITRADLAAAGELLVAVAGQHQQRCLVSPGYQRQLLDSAGGETHTRLLGQMGAAYEAMSAADAALHDLQARLQQATADRDAAEDALQRIDAVDPSDEDEQRLLAVRQTLRHRDRLLRACDESLQALGGDDGGSGAIDLAGQAEAALTAASDSDAGLGEIAADVLGAQSMLSDAAHAVRGRLDDLLAASDDEIDQVEERLAAYDELKRRHGGTVAAVCARRDELARMLAEADDADAALHQAQTRRDEAVAAARACADQLHAARGKLAAKLSRGVERQLTALGMAGAAFQVRIEEAALARHGGDDVSFALAANSGIGAQPLASVASGGELSRVALALSVAAGGHAEAGTLLFDEIDAGIGGRTAHAVAVKLRELSQAAQVLAITHLPQIAARAHNHLHISKADGQTTVTSIDDQDALIDELCRMMGASAADPAARAHAAALREAADGYHSMA